eukprot:scaffold10720_cov69-Phaeocystis_antarctica.AAC.18
MAQQVMARTAGFDRFHRARHLPDARGSLRSTIEWAQHATGIARHTRVDKVTVACVLKCSRAADAAGGSA